MRRPAAMLSLALATAAVASVGAAPALAAVDNHLTLVSAASPESEGNGSVPAAVSDDGRWVAFSSGQQSLTGVDPGAPGVWRMYLRDLQTGTTTRLSPGSHGYASGPAGISADGRYTVFGSIPTSTDVAALRLYDRTTGTSSVISTTTAGTYSDSFSPAISDNGWVVLYVQTTSSDGGATFSSRLLRYDVRTGRTTQPVVAGVLDAQPTLSQDGRYAALGLATASGYQLVRLDLTAGTRQVIGGWATPTATPLGNYARPSISNTGRFVAYALADGAGGAQTYLWDATTGASRLVSHDAAGGPADSYAGNPQVSGDGHYVAYTSGAADVVPGLPGTSTNILLWDRYTDTTQALVTTRQGEYPTRANAGASAPYVDGDGGVVALTSRAQNVVAGTNTRLDRAFAWTR